MSSECNTHSASESLRERIRTERASSLSDVEWRLLSELRYAGIGQILRALNQRTRFRFTGLYRVESSRWASIGLFDRENPSLSFCSDRRVPPGISRSRRFETTLSRESILLRGTDGQVMGSLCHFDYRLRVISHAELVILEHLVPLLVARVASWPKPTARSTNH